MEKKSRVPALDPNTMILWDPWLVLPRSQGLPKFTKQVRRSLPGQRLCEAVTYGGNLQKVFYDPKNKPFI